MTQYAEIKAGKAIRIDFSHVRAKTKAREREAGSTCYRQY